MVGGDPPGVAKDLGDLGQRPGPLVVERPCPRQTRKACAGTEGPRSSAPGRPCRTGRRGATAFLRSPLPGDRRGRAARRRAGNGPGRRPRRGPAGDPRPLDRRKERPLPPPGPTRRPFAAILATLPPREDRDPAAPLFPGLDETAFRTAIARACKATGTQHFSPHGLRRRRGPPAPDSPPRSRRGGRPPGGRRCKGRKCRSGGARRSRSEPSSAGPPTGWRGEWQRFLLPRQARPPIRLLVARCRPRRCRR